MSVDATRATWKLPKTKITAIQKIILLALADRAGENGECWPSIKRMIEDTNLNRKTLIENRQILISLKLIEYTGNFVGKQKQIPVMRLTYVYQDLDGTENGTGEYFTSTENNTGTSTENGTGNQYRNRDTEPKRLEPKKEPKKEINKEKEKSISQPSIPYQNHSVKNEGAVTEKLPPVSNDWEHHQTVYEQQSQVNTTETTMFVSQAEAEQVFECFWEMYPMKKAKNRCLTAWLSQNCYKEAAMILEKLGEQIKKDAQFLDGFPVNPEKYILEERWKDEIYIRPTKPLSGPKKLTFAQIAGANYDKLR